MKQTNDTISSQTRLPGPLALDTAGVTPEECNDLAGSVSRSTSATYVRLNQRIHEWLKVKGLEQLDDTAMAAFVRELEAEGKAPATIEQFIAAAVFRAKTNDWRSPRGRKTEAAVKRIRREHSSRGHGQSDPLTAKDVAMMMTRACDPRPVGRGGKYRESMEKATARGQIDRAMIGLLFQAGLRVSELIALQWRDIRESTDLPGALLIRIRTSKTNQTGDETDIRLIKNECANAVKAIAALDIKPDAHIFDGMSKATANYRVKRMAKYAGVKGRITTHSGRIGLASELTRRGASMQEVMLAGNWRSSQMVAHYSAGATAERGAVAKYL